MTCSHEYHLKLASVINKEKSEHEYKPYLRERNGSVVKCLTRDRGAADSSLNGVTALCS